MAGGPWFSKFLLDEYRLSTQKKARVCNARYSKHGPFAVPKTQRKIKANKYDR